MCKLGAWASARSERNDGLYRPITYLVFKMMEELIIVLCNSLVLSAVVFYPLKLSGDFTLFWLVFLTTSSIGIGALQTSSLDLRATSQWRSPFWRLLLWVACATSRFGPASRRFWCARAVLAYAIAAVSPTMDIANAALPAYVTSLLFFVGLLLRIQDQPAYWKWCATNGPPLVMPGVMAAPPRHVL